MARFTPAEGAWRVPRRDETLANRMGGRGSGGRAVGPLGVRIGRAAHAPRGIDSAPTAAKVAAMRVRSTVRAGMRTAPAPNIPPLPGMNPG